MSSTEAKIVSAARAWAQALAELEAAKQHIETAGEVLTSAELAMHRVAARVETLRSAERALYQAVKLSRAMPVNREPTLKDGDLAGILEEQQHNGT
jgi:hypothetical protein